MATSAALPVLRPFPISPEDIKYSVLARFIDHLSQAVGFGSLARPELAKLALSGMQYGDYTAYCNAASDVAAIDLPDYDSELADMIAWRMYLTNRVGLATALSAVLLAYLRTPFSVKSRYSREGLLLKRDADGVLSWNTESLHLLKLRMVPPVPLNWGVDFSYAHGQIYDNVRHHNQTSIACRYWQPDCGKSAEEMEADFLADSWQTVQDTVLIRKDTAMPPGFRPTTYYSHDGVPIGLGVHCNCVNAYLEQIYPLDGADLLRAIMSLWESKPGPAGIKVPDGFIAEGPYTDPFKPRSIYPGRDGSEIEVDEDSDDGPRGIFDEGAEIERRIFGEEDPTKILDDVTMLPVRSTRLSLGREIRLRGNTWSQRLATFSIEEVQGLLGFEVIPDDEQSWWQETTPWSMSQETSQALSDGLGTAWHLSKEENDELEADASGIATEYARLVARMAAHFHPAIEKEYASRSRRYYPLIMFEGRLLELYPSLSPLTSEERADMAFSFWGKDEFRDALGLPTSPVFLAYCATTLAGVQLFLKDPSEWLYIARLLRLRARESAQASLTSLQEWSNQAVSLYRKLEEMRLFVESLDSLDAPDFWERTRSEEDGGDASMLRTP